MSTIEVAPGEMFDVGNRLYLRCGRCDAIVRHKLMLGFQHLCSAEIDR